MLSPPDTAARSGREGRREGWSPGSALTSASHTGSASSRRGAADVIAGASSTPPSRVYSPRNITNSADVAWRGRHADILRRC